MSPSPFQLMNPVECSKVVIHIVMLVNNSFTWLPYELHHAVYICENKDTDQLHSNPKGNDAHLRAIINL